MQIKPLTLFDLNKQIGELVRKNLPSSYWVVAEISEMRVQAGGHCYLDLIEKGKDDRIVARARAIIWSTVFRMLKPYFETSTGQNFVAGLKILVNATVDFHEVYGFNLTIRDIRPEFTIGELEMKRRKTLKMLEEQGIINMNRETELPLVIQSVAVISSETAAGYGDFMHQLHANSYGFAFYTRLFPALMQGEDAPASIIHALEQIFRLEEYFDVVVLIRGGGAVADLNCFDDYNLACHLAQFSLPVLTGIGHERDETIADRVAHTNLKTPTAVAEFIIAHNLNFFDRLMHYSDSLAEVAASVIEPEKEHLQYLANNIESRLVMALSKANHKLDRIVQHVRNLSYIQIEHKKREAERLQEKLSISANNHLKRKHEQNKVLKKQLHWHLQKYFSSHQKQLRRFEVLAKVLSPENTINRGYTLTLKGKKIIHSVSMLSKGDVISTLHKSGTIESEVKTIRDKP